MKIVVDSYAFWVITILVHKRIEYRYFKSPFWIWPLRLIRLSLEERFKGDRLQLDLVDCVREQGLINYSDFSWNQFGPETEQDDFDGKMTGVFLTKLGCKVWEAVSRANWDAYVEYDYHRLDDNIFDVSLTSIDENRMILYFNESCKSDEIRGISRLIDGTEKLSLVQPWYPSYWKTFKSASRITYHVERIVKDTKDNPDESDSQWDEMHSKLITLNRDALNLEWYTIPKEFPQIVELSDG